MKHRKKKVNFPILQKLSRLKCNTSKILNFHDVLKILRNRRLTHTSFYFFNNFLNMQKVKSNPFKKCQLSFFLLKWQNWTLTREKYWIFVFSLINSLLDDKHTQISVFQKFHKNEKSEVEHLEKNQLSHFLKNVKTEV